MADAALLLVFTRLPQISANRWIKDSGRDFSTSALFASLDPSPQGLWAGRGSWTLCIWHVNEVTLLVPGDKTCFQQNVPFFLHCSIKPETVQQPWQLTEKSLPVSVSHGIHQCPTPLGDDRCEHHSDYDQVFLPRVTKANLWQTLQHQNLFSQIRRHFYNVGLWGKWI